MRASDRPHRLGYCVLAFFLVGCSRFTPPAELPVASSLILDELVIYSDFQFPDNHRLLIDLQEMRSRITEELDLLPSDEPVEVYLFKTPRRYQKFLSHHYPQFPERRAFFVQTDTRLCVYTYWGDRIAEDLRHEVCHGYLHAAVPNIPLWLDEGLAEFYERDESAEGFHQEHVDQLVAARERGDWQPQLARLESLEKMEEMSELEYAEAWLWTHFLLQTTEWRKNLLRETLRTSPQKREASLWQQLHLIEPDVSQQLLDHLAQLQSADRLAP